MPDMEISGSSEGSSERRTYAFVLEAGVKLGAGERTVATAAILLSRFLRKLPPTVHDVCPFSAAAAALYLAGKVEEEHLKIRDVVNVAYRALHPEEDVLEVGDKYWGLRDGLGNLEVLLARTLAFHFHVPHPQPFLLHYLHALRSWLPREDWEGGHLAHIANTFLRDAHLCPRIVDDHRPQVPHPQPFLLHYLHALRSWLPREDWEGGHLAHVANTFLRDAHLCPRIVDDHRPQMTALACVALALEAAGLSVPFALEADPTPWYKVFYPRATSRDLYALCDQLLLNVYQKPPP